MLNIGLKFKPTQVLKFKASPVLNAVSYTNPVSMGVSAISLSIIITLVSTCVVWITTNSFDPLHDILHNIHRIRDVIMITDFEHFDGVNESSLVELITNLNDLQTQVDRLIQQLGSHVNNTSNMFRDMRGRVAVLIEIYRLIEEVIPRLEDILGKIRD